MQFLQVFVQFSIGRVPFFVFICFLVYSRFFIYYFLWVYPFPFSSNLPLRCFHSSLFFCLFFTTSQRRIRCEKRSLFFGVFLSHIIFIILCAIWKCAGSHTPSSFAPFLSTLYAYLFIINVFLEMFSPLRIFIDYKIFCKYAEYIGTMCMCFCIFPVVQLKKKTFSKKMSILLKELLHSLIFVGTR